MSPQQYTTPTSDPGRSSPTNADKLTAYSKVFSALEQHGYEPRQAGTGAKALCPGHDDHHPSLSIDVEGDGTVLLYCQSRGCSTKKILQAIGLEERDLFLASRPTGGRRKAIGAVPSDRAPRRARQAFPTLEAAIASLACKLGQPVAHWVYRDAAGAESFRVYRFHSPKDGKKQYRPLHRSVEGWVTADPPGLLPLYRLPELAGPDLIFVTEGEKCADLAIALGLPATTSAHGAQSAGKTDWSPLSGKRRVAILPDHDAPGGAFAGRVIRLVGKLEHPPEVVTLVLPGLSGEGDDIEQFIELRRGEGRAHEQIRNEILALAEDATPVDLSLYQHEATDDAEPPVADAVDRSGRKTPERRGPSQAETLLRLSEPLTLFHTPDGKAYATAPVETHYEHHAIRSRAFKLWLTRRYYGDTHGTPSSEAMEQATATLEAKACFGGTQEEVHLRVAEVRGPLGRTLYLDLADDRWRVVEIDARGWRVVENPPVKFRRTSTMRPLPTPEKGGLIGDLRNFVNVAGEQDWRLFVASLCSYVRPTGPYPVLAIQGEQGSAKSTTTRIVGRLIDPSAILRRPPRDERDLMIAANNSWVMTMDNLSGLPPWLSDSLCRLSTGGGIATRALYTNDEETIFSATRPIVLNGIDDITERPDLADRAVVLHLPRITAENRLTETEFYGRFDAEAPKILGALLDVVSAGLRALPGVHPGFLPRMADFATWGEAVGRGQGWGDGVFLEAFNSNQKAASAAATETCPLAKAVVALMNYQPAWGGTATQLHDLLSGKFVADAVRHGKEWPKSASELSRGLHRIAPRLRDIGLVVEFPRSGKARSINIKRQAEKEGNLPSLPSLASLPRNDDRKSLEGNGLSGESSNDANAPPTVIGRPIAVTGGPGSPFYAADDATLIDDDPLGFLDSAPLTSAAPAANGKVVAI